MTTKRKSANDTKKHGKNLKMNDNTYAMRREVMTFVYEAKNFLKSNGINLPRIDIRITEDGVGRHLGLARLGDNIVWIPVQTLNKAKYKPFLRDIVFHEIVHASTGFGHDDLCPLMSPCIGRKPMTTTKLQKVFLTYFKK